MPKLDLTKGEVKFITCSLWMHSILGDVIMRDDKLMGTILNIMSPAEQHNFVQATVDAVVATPHGESAMRKLADTLE